MEINPPLISNPNEANKKKDVQSILVPGLLRKVFKTLQRKANSFLPIYKEHSRKKGHSEAKKNPDCLELAKELGQAK